MQWRYTCRRSPRRESQCYERDIAWGAAPTVRAVKSSEFGEESCEHLRWTHLEQVQHCTDLPRQVTFPAHTEQGKHGARVGMNVTAQQEKEKNKETKEGKRRTGEKKK